MNAPAADEDEEGSVTEVHGGLDIAFRAHLAYKNRGALVAEYSWNHIGAFRGGKLYQAGFRLSLIFGASR